MKRVWLSTCICLAVFITNFCFLSAGNQGNLQIAAISPAASAVSVARETPITVEFDRPADVNTVDVYAFAVFGRLSGAANGTFSFAMGNRQVTFTPKRPFSAGELVDVVLSHDITDTEGAALRSAGYAWSFWAQAGKAGLMFKRAGRLSTGTNVRTYGGLGADLNGDGALDLAVVGEVSADMRVFLNNGDGTFGERVAYPIRPGASPNAAADFNKDGATDIATCNVDDNTVSVLLGNGDGSFSPQRVYRVGNTPAGIAVLDVNGDGYMDIVVCNSGTSDMSLLINNGDGTFAAERRFFSTPGARFYGLAAADMNGDGIPDLVVGAQGSQRVYVLLGNGDGTFTQSSSQRALGAPWVLRTADLNGDGYVDVAVVNHVQNNMAILFGDGDGNLSEPVSYRTGNSPASVSLGDLDGDGSLDVVVSNFGSSTYMIFTNDGAGQLTDPLVLRATRAGSCAILHDFDGDGDLDITGVDELEDELILWENV